MKISRLLQVMFVSGSAFVVVPGLAASLPVSADAPVSQCGGEKHEKAGKDDKKDDKKNEKQEPKGEKEPA